MFFYQNEKIPEMLCSADDMKMLELCFRAKEIGIQNNKNFTDEDLEAWKYSFSMNGASFKYPINYYRNIFNAKKQQADLVLEVRFVIWSPNFFKFRPFLLEATHFILFNTKNSITAIHSK